MFLSWMSTDKSEETLKVYKLRLLNSLKHEFHLQLWNYLCLLRFCEPRKKGKEPCHRNKLIFYDFVLKGHRGFSVENVLNKNTGRPSRRPVSIAACGMLNSRRGGESM